MSSSNHVMTYILVSDSFKAFFYAKKPYEFDLELINSLSSEISRIPNSSLGMIKPHGIFERNRPEARVDIHNKAKKEFAFRIANFLNSKSSDHEFESLILVAPPKFLGYLKVFLSSKVVKTITKEIKKDLTKIDRKSLQKYID